MYYRLYAQRIFSEKWLEQVDFYESVVGLDRVFFNDQLGFAMFTLDTAYLAIEKTSSDNHPNLIGRYVGLTLQVKNLNDAYDRRGLNY
ncbi:hypothetical protein CF392_14955 [Tamilnaduibacter salinus]|uniref:Glyoxalase n=1 Tax=Tamilnaduibacter salinus TaxID=1484056 RepID=A0A2A2HZU5_9GAMM|nr:hypothetical protein [Tamilnaduibacter salinus]PAV24678.1 hypothetical protein CF392_14955 [Tamilnaduibacter salinus]